MREEDDFELEPIEILELPLDAWHRDKGARMVEFAGYHMPIQYEGIIAEHLWTRENAGLFDQPLPVFHKQRHKLIESLTIRRA